MYHFIVWVYVLYSAQFLGIVNLETFLVFPSLVKQKKHPTVPPKRKMSAYPCFLGKAPDNGIKTYQFSFFDRISKSDHHIWKSPFYVLSIW